MKPRITLITLGVDDLPKSVQFYRDGLGLHTNGIVGTELENGAVAFFDLQSGLKLALWPRKSIAHDTGLPQGGPCATEFTIGHNVSSKAEVDAVMAQAKNAGAGVVKEAHDTLWGGYAGYFQDPDGHVWEVAWNPQWDLREVLRAPGRTRHSKRSRPFDPCDPLWPRSRRPQRRERQRVFDPFGTLYFTDGHAFASASLSLRRACSGCLRLRGVSPLYRAHRQAAWTDAG